MARETAPIAVACSPNATGIICNFEFDVKRYFCFFLLIRSKKNAPF